jgi:hypothetical protein
MLSIPSGAAQAQFFPSEIVMDEKVASDVFDEIASRVLEEVLRDPSVVFGTEANKLAKHFERVRWYSKTWQRPQLCMYRGCSAMSVARSHSIQKSGPLARIAEDQHILTPKLNLSGKLEMASVGVNTASVFPGFCRAHESLFSDFESEKSLTLPRHFALQAFRSVCCEIARQRQNTRSNERVLEQYRTARLDFFSNAVRQGAPDAKVKSLQICGDSFERQIMLHIRSSNITLAELSELHHVLTEYIEGRGEDPLVFGLHLPFQFPIACSGLGTLHYRKSKRTRTAHWVLGILPEAEGVLAYFVSTKEHKDMAEWYFSKMQEGFGALNAIESWLVNGSDHWFIRASMWHQIPASRRDRILIKIMQADADIGADIDFSILDDARRLILSHVKSALSGGEDPDIVLGIIKNEEAKLWT